MRLRELADAGCGVVPCTRVRSGRGSAGAALLAVDTGKGLGARLLVLEEEPAAAAGGRQGWDCARVAMSVVSPVILLCMPA